MYHRLFLFLICLAGCGVPHAVKEERAKIEIALRKIRNDLDEIKHDLNSNQLQLQVLGGELHNQETSLQFLKEELLDKHQNRTNQAINQLAQLEKKFPVLEKKLEEMAFDMRKLTLFSHETTTALSQYQEKINEVEKNITLQNQKMQEIAKIRNALKELLHPNAKTFSYTIKTGDTLDKIAKTYGTTVEIIKRLNKLDDDTIYAGQEVLIPTAYCNH